MYFTNPKNLLELKTQFRRLALIHHPDCGGSNEAMKAINSEYEKLFEQIKSGFTPEEQETFKYENLNDGYREQVLKILFLPDITIELIGSWLWISGNTKAVKEQLKEAGFNYSAPRCLWYWRPGTKKHRGKASNMDISVIKARYGSSLIENTQKNLSYA